MSKRIRPAPVQSDATATLVRLERREGWEARLAEVVEWARAKPYELGTHDCVRVAFRAVEALTGVDLWAEWGRTYRTKEDAARIVIDIGGGFTGCFSTVFGGDPLPMPAARRGDIAEFRDPDGEKHLGVVTGASVAVLGEHGVGFIPRSACRHCWRIG
jgi:hypothetical protein